MRNIVIMGAGGRDFHDFNVVFRDDPETRVVAFTAAQIPGIAGRTYPPSLAGPSYPDGIPILPEEELPAIVREHHVDEVVFAYSDLSHEEVMHQTAELEATIEAADCDVVVAGTPIDLRRVVRTGHPVRQARYELREVGSPTLADVLAPVVQRARAAQVSPDGATALA